MKRPKIYELVLNQRGQRADFSWLPALAKILDRKFKIKGDISLALVNEAEIKKLNQVYRRKNKVTDVLSFGLDSPDILGEVVICLAQAKRQAEENKVSLKKELQLLTTHGILHLLGYDHAKSQLAAQAQSRQEKIILEQLN